MATDPSNKLLFSGDLPPGLSGRDPLDAHAESAWDAEIRAARSQIARRLGLGSALVAGLLGILFLAENQLSWLHEDPLGEISFGKPLTPREEEKDAPEPLPPGSAVAEQEVKPGDSPASGAAVPGEEKPPVAESVPDHEEVAEPTQHEAPAQRSRERKERKGLSHLPGGQASARSLDPDSRPAAPAISLVPPSPRRGESTQTLVLPGSSKNHTLTGPSRLFTSYLVQAGVFSNHGRAEELQALLIANGIPSTLETRVQVGPFKNKAEADAARSKLKLLGVESLLLPPRK